MCHTPCGESTTGLGAYSLCATLGFSKRRLSSEFLHLHSEGEGMPSWMDLVSERVPIRQHGGWIRNQGRSVKEICFLWILGSETHGEAERLRVPFTNSYLPEILAPRSVLFIWYLVTLDDWKGLIWINTQGAEKRWQAINLIPPFYLIVYSSAEEASELPWLPPDTKTQCRWCHCQLISVAHAGRGRTRESRPSTRPRTTRFLNPHLN